MTQISQLHLVYNLKPIFTAYMSGDFIQVKKEGSGDEYLIRVYFAGVSSEVNIRLKEADFIRFLDESVRIINRNSHTFRLQVPEDIEQLIEEQQGKRELDQLSSSIALLMAAQKPRAEVTIYIPDQYVQLTDAEAITNASGDFMEALGFELETEDEPVFGSFFKKLRFVFSRTIGQEDLEQLYSKGKKALELKYVELPTADQTEKLANAAEKLVRSLDGVNEGVVRCGALIVLKKMVDGETKLIIQQLSSELIILLDKHPQLLFNLNTTYELLTGDVKKGQNDSDFNEQVLIA